MAYTPKEWACGDTITAEDLNHIEQGISENSGGGTEPLIIRVTEEEVKDPQTQETVGYKTNALASDVYEAWQNGRPIYRGFNEYEAWLVSSVEEHNVYTIYLGDGNSLTVETLREFPFTDGYLTFFSDEDDEN